MAELFELEVATPERLMVREEVAEAQVPGKNGYLGILPGHAPLLGQLGTGVLSYGAGMTRHHIAIGGGFLEVLPDHVRVLADSAERAEDIDINKARAELKRAQDELPTAADPDAALAAVEKAQARVDAAEKR